MYFENYSNKSLIAEINEDAVEENMQEDDLALVSGNPDYTVQDATFYVRRTDNCMYEGGIMKMRYLKMIFLITLLIAFSGCNGKRQTIGLSVRGNNFDISNTEGETVNCRNGGFSGDMDLINQQVLEEPSGSADRYLLEVAFSDSFTYQCEGDGGQLFGIVSAPNLDVSSEGYFEYTVSGIGMETITVTPDGKMTFSGNEAFADIAGSMPCENLGEHGFIRLSAGTTETATVSIDVENSKIHFSGLSAGEMVLSYAGTVSNSLLTVELSAGSGSIDFSELDMGQIILAEDGHEDQIITV